MPQKNAGNDERSVLIVDEDAGIRTLLRSQLDNIGFHATECRDGLTARDLLQARAFDLIVVDADVPRLDGFALCLSARSGGPNVDRPILMVSARHDEGDKVAGLDSGADDYLVKPFGASELLARVAAILRRHERSRTADRHGQRSIGDLTLDVERRTVLRHGRPVVLTRQEFDVLERLTARPGLVLSRSALLQAVWKNDSRVTTRTVDAVISRLRQKIESDPGRPSLLRAVRGIGYRFVEDE